MIISNINIVITILMASSLIVLVLEAIGNKPFRSSLYEKAHIRLFSIGAVLLSLVLIVLDLMSQAQLLKQPQLFFDDILTMFLLINTLIAIHLGNKTILNKQSGDIYFLILSSLIISIVNISTDYLILKLINSTGWLIIMATLAIKTTSGGKKAEIGLKITFNAILVFLLLLFSLYLLTYSSHVSDLSSLAIEQGASETMGILGLSLFILAGLSLAGIPPFSFAHIDCADGSNLSTAFLLLSNAIIQGASHLIDARAIILRSDALTDVALQIIGFILAAGLLMAWLRALDQSKIRRTMSYIASSIGPVFCLSLLFGTSELLPKLVFIMAVFSFLTLSLFVLFGALAYMEPIGQHWQTWEDIAGFGRKNKVQTLYLLIALASIAGLPGTLGYFIKLSLIAPMKDNIIFSGTIFISIAFGAACTMRMFVFLFSKQSTVNYQEANELPPFSLMVSALVLIALGLFPFVR
jgi:NADH-quinone oxidoreductase subunit N